MANNKDENKSDDKKERQKDQDNKAEKKYHIKHAWISGSKFNSNLNNSYFTSSPVYSFILNNDVSHWPVIEWQNEELNSKTKELYETIEKLRKEVEDKAREMQSAEQKHAQNQTDLDQLKANYLELMKKEKLGFLLTRVPEEAQQLLLGDEEFQKGFIDEKECNAYVMSVDIRRSTELMSKARSPQLFARFMTSLCKDLESIIKSNYGVFDKFTGDGILAFFPEFFSGEDAGYFVIKAAHQCHEIFKDKYREHRSSFKSVLIDVGLGIGIDYGPTHLVQIAGGITAVGAPVVYACRMGGAPANTTYLNQPGYEKISQQYSEYCFLQEKEIDIKNEGSTLAYEVQLNGKDYEPQRPKWSNP